MSTLTAIATVGFILLTWNQMTDGLACYSCTNCNDPFNSYGVNVRYLNDSTSPPYYCTKTTTGYNTSRDANQNCTQFGDKNYGSWCCQTNLCNGSQRNMIRNTFSFGIGLFILMIFV